MALVMRLCKKKYIIFVILISLLFGLAGTMYNVFVKNRQSSMVIEFNYPGSEKGLNPDGSIFEIFELKSNEVIEKAKANLKNNDIDTDFLRSRIFITTKFSSQSLDRIVSAVQGETNTIYMPTAFYIYYSQKDKFSKNESDLFMESLAKAYSDYFSEKYSEKNDILVFKAEDYDFENIDYVEIHQILENKIDSMLSYIKTHQNENRAFYSEDMENLGTAAKKLESFRDTNLEKFYAYIVQNGISKDSEMYLKSLDYFIDENELEYRKLIEGSDLAKEAIEKYEKDIIAVVYVPSVDSKRNYYMSRTKTSIDYLTKQSYSDGMLASKILKDVAYYRDLKSKFSASREDSAQKLQSAEAMINDLSKNLEEISKELVKVDNEYLEHKTMNYFNIRLPSHNSISIVFIIKFMILGFIFSLAIVVFVEFFRKKLFEKLRTIDLAFSAIERANKNRGE